MSSTPRKWKFRLRHMLEAIAECRGFVAGMTREQFDIDSRVIRAENAAPTSGGIRQAVCRWAVG